MKDGVSSPKLQVDSKGFTIIEVMIVLAIAALILLIVLLAVPALQRNSRNTQRKNDVARLGTTATNVITNNGGSVSALTSSALRNAAGKLGYYETTKVFASNLSGPGMGMSIDDNDSLTESVYVMTNARCTTDTDASYSPGSVIYRTKGIAVLYYFEAGSSLQPRCINA